MTDHNHPPVCSCPGDPSASAAGWSPECRIHGTDANRHPHYRDSTDKRSAVVGTGQSPIVADAALKCADCPHPGDQPCNTRATECGAALRPVPTEAELLAQRPPNFVRSNMEAIERDLDFVMGYANPCPVCAAVPPHHTQNCPHYQAEVEPTDDPIIIGKRGGLRWGDIHHDVEVEVGEGALRPTGGYAADIAQHAIDLFTGDRNADYGDATDNFQDIADLWSVVLRPILQPGAAITAEQVAIMSAQIKIARLNTSPHHDDSWVDATAYLALGGGIHRRRQVADVGGDTPTTP